MKRNSMVQWMNLHWNNGFVNWTQLPFYVKNWSHTPSGSVSYGREAGRQSDEILVDLEIYKILYRSHR